MDFSGPKTVIRDCHLGKFIFIKSTQKDGHFDTRHDPFWEEKKLHPLLSLNPKTLDGVQRAETHFFAQVSF
jgi:hypothetical protein